MNPELETVGKLVSQHLLPFGQQWATSSGFPALAKLLADEQLHQLMARYGESVLSSFTQSKRPAATRATRPDDERARAGAPDDTELRELNARVEDVAFAEASAETPPRSVTLTEQVCYFEPGGAVVSSSTGALLAIMAYGTGETCGDPQGRSIATRLAPFGRLLTDAAEAAGSRLREEATQRGWQELRLARVAS